MRGDHPLVEAKGTNWIEIALDEILADKVRLIPFEGAGQPVVPEDDGRQEDPDEDGPPSGRKKSAASKN